MVPTPKCNSLLFASPVTCSFLTSHSASFKMGTIRGFICAKYTIAHLRMHNAQHRICQDFYNSGFTEWEQRFHDIRLIGAMTLQFKSKLVTRRWSKTTAANSQERTSMNVFNLYILKGKQYENKKFSIIVSSLHEQNLDAYPFTILTMRRRIKRVKEKREYTRFGLELPS